jgi:methionyl-tRNA synthetase
MLVWIITWKGFALWKAAELRQKGWFIAILLIQTLGLLEIVYIFFIAKRYKVEVVEQ